jgi:hypothetical protein
MPDQFKITDRVLDLRNPERGQGVVIGVWSHVIHGTVYVVGWPPRMVTEVRGSELIAMPDKWENPPERPETAMDRYHRLPLYQLTWQNRLAAETEDATLEAVTRQLDHAEQYLAWVRLYLLPLDRKRFEPRYLAARQWVEWAERVRWEALAADDAEQVSA